MKVETRYLSDLSPDPNNVRTHDKRNIEAIARSLKAFGQRKPIVVTQDGTVIAGNGTLEAARSLGWDEIAVAITPADWTSDQLTAYAIADNRTAELAGWDKPLLDATLEELALSGIELADIGFDLDDVSSTEPKEDDVPEPPADPITKFGDLWLLGDHRVLCGDSTKKDDVVRVLRGGTADVCLTDPPYGLGDTVSVKNNYSSYNDTKENLIELVERFLPLAQEHARCVVLTPGNSNQHIYPTPTWTMAWFVPAGTGMGPWGFVCWQPLLCYGKDPKLSKGKGSHPDAIVHTERADDVAHPCSKPVGFWSWLVNRTTERGESIFDPFCGSGTGVIAAEQTGRVCYGIELDPAYCDVIVQRWETLTGKTATRETAPDETAHRKPARTAAQNCKGEL